MEDNVSKRNICIVTVFTGCVSSRRVALAPPPRQFCIVLQRGTGIASNNQYLSRHHHWYMIQGI